MKTMHRKAIRYFTLINVLEAELLSLPTVTH